jgi:hypothetical protein
MRRPNSPAIERPEKHMASMIDTERVRGKAAASQGTGGGGGGSVDDTQKRLGIIETAIAEIKAILVGLATKAELQQFRGETKAELEKVRGDIREISATLPHLATKEEIKSLHLATKEEIRSLHLATKEEIKDLQGDIREIKGLFKVEINALENRQLKWFIGTVITCATLAFSIAKFVV